MLCMGTHCPNALRSSRPAPPTQSVETVGSQAELGNQEKQSLGTRKSSKAGDVMPGKIT